MSKIILVFSDIRVGKLTQVFVFPGSFVVSDFGPDLVFQLLTLTAGLVSLLDQLLDQLNFNSCSCLGPSLLPGLGTSLGHGLSVLILTFHWAHPCFQGNVLFCVFW